MSKNENDEIEITPEMIEAGVIAISDYSMREDRLSDIVTAVFEAMSGRRFCNAQRKP